MDRINWSISARGRFQIFKYLITLIHLKFKSKEVDFVVGPFAISYFRYEVIDFVSYLSGDDVTMLVKTPHANTSPSAVLKPFTITVT